MPVAQPIGCFRFGRASVMTLLGAGVRALDVPGELAARLRTSLYRRTCTMAPSARIHGAGRIHNSAGNRAAVTIGAQTVIRGELFVFPHAGKISLGEWSYVGEGSRIWSSAAVTIGARVLIAHDVNIHDTNGHPLDALPRHEHTRAIFLSGHPRTIDTIAARPVTIGDDAWIGFGATVLKGVTIGPGAIVAARSVVVDDVAPWTVVAGNPACIVRQMVPS